MCVDQETFPRRCSWQVWVDQQVSSGLGLQTVCWPPSIGGSRTCQVACKMLCGCTARPAPLILWDCTFIFYFLIQFLYSEVCF